MILEFACADVMPARPLVIAQLGIPDGAAVSPTVEHLADAAADLFAQHVAPIGIVAELSTAEFAQVYQGDGRNERASPVSDILGRAEHLALFAVTLGEALSQALRRCQDEEDFALAYTLDAVASVAADGLADLVEQRFLAHLRGRGWATPDGAVLRYSPGYCGWDITGQRTLFACLRPEQVGLTLTESCLMQPLKSVSGVLVAGPRAIHRFPPTYDFCSRCEARTCRDRLRALFTHDPV